MQQTGSVTPKICMMKQGSEKKMSKLTNIINSDAMVNINIELAIVGLT